MCLYQDGGLRRKEGNLRNNLSEVPALHIQLPVLGESILPLPRLSDHLHTSVTNPLIIHEWIWSGYYVLPVGRGRCNGSGNMDPGGEERLHQPAFLQHVRSLCLHPDPSRGHRHGNGCAGMLCHLQGTEEPSESGERTHALTHSHTHSHTQCTCPFIGRHTLIQNNLTFVW